MLNRLWLPLWQIQRHKIYRFIILNLTYSLTRKAGRWYRPEYRYWESHHRRRGFGWWCESDSVEKITGTADAACHADLPALGQAAYGYLEEHYTAEKGYEIIMEKLK